MLGEFPGIPDMSMALVDVRDCAQAHLQALKVKEAAGKRFMLVENTYKMDELAGVLHGEYAQYGYPIPTRGLPYFLIQIGSLFDGEAAMVKEMWGKVQTFENKETKDILGINFIPMKKGVLDMSKTLIETGYTPDYQKNGKPPNVMMKATIMFAIILFLIFFLNMQLKA